MIDWVLIPILIFSLVFIPDISTMFLYPQIILTLSCLTSFLIYLSSQQHSISMPFRISFYQFYCAFQSLFLTCLHFVPSEFCTVNLEHVPAHARKTLQSSQKYLYLCYIVDSWGQCLFHSHLFGQCLTEYIIHWRQQRPQWMLVEWTLCKYISVHHFKIL